MKRKAILTFKVLPFFLLVLLISGSLLISGCSPSDIIFGPSGSINVDTYPSGAKVFLNGNDTGEITPCTITNLVRGTYEVTVILDGIIYIETVIVYPNKITSVYKDFLYPYLEKINVLPWWTSIILSLGNNVTIISVTAYYSDYSSANIPLTNCVYSSNDTCATVNGSGTITGISAGIAVITVSYTEEGITKTDTVWVDIRDNPTDTPIIPPGPTPEPEPEPEPDEILQAKVIITKLEQSLNYAWIYYEIENTGSIDIDFYQIWFTVKCTDNSEYTDWTVGLDLKVGDKRNDYGLVDVGEKTAESVEIKNWELTNYGL